MQVSRLTLENFRGSKSAELEFDGHTLLIGGNNVGKSTICEALELALGPDRQRRFPVVEECPSSKHLGLLSLFHKGGSGSSWIDVKPLVVDGSSGGVGWSVS